MVDESLLVAKVTEIRGTKIRAKVFRDKNEAFIFCNGNLVRNVSVGGYVKIPCGFDQVIGRIEGEVQQEKFPTNLNYDERMAQGSSFDRFIDISVFGVRTGSCFDRGITVLPLVSSDVFVLTAEELALISSSADSSEFSFRIGSLAGHDGVPVVVSPSKLFASHIGVFGNTGSGKSNTLCRLYTDCFKEMQESGSFYQDKARFAIIDFNGEYVEPDVLTPDKDVVELSTRERDGRDKVPVPKDFYFDLEIWSILTQATEKTQRPFLKSCIRTAGKIIDADNPSSYLRGMVITFIKEYCGHEIVFPEQREDFIRTFSFLLATEPKRAAEDEIRVSIEDIEAFSGNGPTVLRRGTGFYGNTPADLSDGVFGPFFQLDFSYDALVANIPDLLEFVAGFLFLQRWRSGSITREHISCWLPRFSAQLSEARKLYNLSEKRTSATVTVYSLLDVNQEQKKMIPLILAKYLYAGQKERGRNNEESSTHLIIDEAHNILSYSSQRESESWRDYRLETFEEIIKEGRKFGMYLTVSSQRPSDISSTIISQMHNYFIHRLVNDEDLSAIAKAVAFIDGATSSMIPVLPQGTCIVSGTAVPYPTQVQIEQLPKNQRPRSADRDLAAAWSFGAAN